jgi:hypothetical protein
MRGITAIREGDSNPYGLAIQHTTLDYIGAVLAILLGGAIICGHVWAVVYVLRLGRASTTTTVVRRGRSANSN